MSKTHFFNVEVAVDYSVNQSIILSSLMWWFDKAQTHQENYKNGKYWVRMSAPAIKKLKPYFSVRQVRISLEKLVENNLLLEDAFNTQKNDHTKWYSPTDLAKEYYGVTTKKQGYKNVTPQGYKNVTQGYKNVTSIYKEVDRDSRYILLLKKLENNSGLIEVVALQNSLKVETVKNQIKKFIKQVEAVGEVYNNDKEFYKHFQNWVAKQDLSDVNIDTELTWFINQFNAIAKKEFVITDTLRNRFAKQLSYGFTGNQMVQAVRNLYSNSEKNKFHQNNHFKFATPEYLLKDDNLNKYLNFVA